LTTCCLNGMNSLTIKPMTEYEEITQGYTVEDCRREIAYQCDVLGYSITDSFPQYLIDLIEFLTYKTATL